MLLSVCCLQVRKAVGLGRMALDPLAVISTLLGRRKELLSLKLHELQERLPQELLATRLEQVCVVCWVLLCCGECLA
jgi:transcriptional accessory protein Tex/SPT6